MKNKRRPHSAYLSLLMVSTLLIGCSRPAPSNPSSKEFVEMAANVSPIDYMSEAIDKVDPHPLTMEPSSKIFSKTDRWRRMSGYYLEVTEPGSGVASFVPRYMQSYCMASRHRYAGYGNGQYLCSDGNDNVYFYIATNIKRLQRGIRNWASLDVEYDIIEPNTSIGITSFFKQLASDPALEKTLPQKLAQSRLKDIAEELAIRRKIYERKRKLKLEEEERERKLKLETEEENRQRKAEIVRDRDLVTKFRKAVKIGIETHCGLIVSINGPVAIVQTLIGQYGMKISQLYPPDLAPCRFMNGAYEDPLLPY